jgi:hypothetical protein
MSPLGQTHFRPTQQKAKAQKYFDSELRATSAEIPFRYRKHLFLLNVYHEAVDSR